MCVDIWGCFRTFSKTQDMFRSWRYHSNGLHTEAALRSVLKKRFSENMQQIYRRTPMPKCDFNKVALCGTAASLHSFLIQNFLF